MGTYISLSTKRPQSDISHSAKTKNYSNTEPNSTISKSPEKRRIFAPSEKSQEPVLFLTVRKRYLCLTEQGQQFLMGIPNKRDIAFVINYGRRSQQVHNILKGEADQYYSQQDQTKIYLSTIGHCGNLTALLLDWKGRFNPHIFSILLCISSLIVFSSSSHTSHTFDKVAELIPVSCITIESMKKLNQASTLPTFLWLQYSQDVHPFQPNQQQIRGDNSKLLAKKRRFDQQLFQQAFQSIRIQQFQPPNLYLGLDQNVKKVYDFEEKKIFDQLRVKILEDLEPKALANYRISPKMALLFISQFQNRKYTIEYFGDILSNILEKQSIEIRKKIFCLLDQEKAQLVTEDNKRQIAKRLKKNLVPLITEFKRYYIRDQDIFVQYFDSQLKVFQLYLNDLQVQQSETREHYLNGETNQVLINQRLIAEGIKQKAFQQKKDTSQVLYEERKRLQSQGNNYSAYTRLAYLEKVRNYFEQKNKEEVSRLEKKNTTKIDVNAALTMKKEKEINANLDSNKKPVYLKWGEKDREFQLMNEEDLGDYI